MPKYSDVRGTLVEIDSDKKTVTLTTHNSKPTYELLPSMTSKPNWESELVQLLGIDVLLILSDGKGYSLRRG